MWRTTVVLAGAVGLSSAASAQHDLALHRAEEHRDKANQLGRLVYTDISFDVVETPVSDVLAMIADRTSTTIIARYDTDALSHGIDPDQPITLTARDQPALRVLEMVLGQSAPSAWSSCTWQLRSGYIEVGTKERLGGPGGHRLVVYPLADLLHDVNNFDNAPDLDVAGALSQSSAGARGVRSGGGIGNGGGGRGGSLIGDPGDEPERLTAEISALEMISVITRIIEPERWWPRGDLSIRHHRRTLLVRAPDFVQRQIGGYPFDLRPEHIPADRARRLTFTGDGTLIELPPPASAGHAAPVPDPGR